MDSIFIAEALGLCAALGGDFMVSLIWKKR